MADVFDPELRRRAMQSNKSKNTKPELIVFKYLRNQGIYFQKHYDKLPGKPDVALPRKKKCVFIDGDFWHGRLLSKMLKLRAEDDPWIVKIRSNITRDLRQREDLKNKGWEILVIWETDLTRSSTQLIALERIKKFLISK